MKKKLTILVIAAMLLSIPFISLPTYGEDVIPVGEPLHIYLRRQPVQDYTYLFFHPPDDTYSQLSRDNTTYRKSLLAKGSGFDFEVLYFPQDPISNFLQFEPNETIPLTYNFTIAAQRPVDLTDTTYIVNVKIEIDYNHDRNYDKVISFDITGRTISDVETKTGTIEIDTSELEKMNFKEGGRLRINISRKDDIDTLVTIYCGYHGFHSYLELPYSKYKQPSDENVDERKFWPYFLGIAGVFVIAAVAFFYFKQKQEESRPKEPEKGKRSHRRR